MVLFHDVTKEAGVPIMPALLFWSFDGGDSRGIKNSSKPVSGLVSTINQSLFI